MKLNVKGGTGIIVRTGNRGVYDNYLREVQAFKPLSREEEYAAFVDYRENGSIKAKERIQKHNLLFVVSVARKYSVILSSNTLYLEDLINEGNIGLINAIDKFDYTSGFKFISYAVWHIKKQILQSINLNNKSIRMPMNMRNELNQFLKERKKLEQEFGRDVANAEVFDSLFKQNVLKENDTVEKFERLLLVDNYDLSLNALVTDDKVELAELLVSEDYNPLTGILEEDISKTLKNYLNDVPKPYRSFIIKYYGLFGHEQMTCEEISEKYDIALTTVKTKINSYVRWLSRRKKRPENVFN